MFLFCHSIDSEYKLDILSYPRYFRILANSMKRCFRLLYTLSENIFTSWNKHFLAFNRMANYSVYRITLHTLLVTQYIQASHTRLIDCIVLPMPYKIFQTKHGNNPTDGFKWQTTLLIVFTFGVHLTDLVFIESLHRPH